MSGRFCDVQLIFRFTGLVLTWVPQVLLHFNSPTPAPAPAPFPGALCVLNILLLERSEEPYFNWTLLKLLCVHCIQNKLATSTFHSVYYIVCTG